MDATCTVWPGLLLSIWSMLKLYFCSAYWRASVASETLTEVKMKKSGMFVYWRASEASETLSGETQSRFRYIYWRASVASETLTGVTQLKIGDVCLYICLDVHMSFCTLTLAFLC